jgi:hypothetical protein
MDGCKGGKEEEEDVEVEVEAEGSPDDAMIPLPTNAPEKIRASASSA